MDNDDLTTWEKLRRQVIEASTAYYNTDSPTLSDFEFDILKRRAMEVGCSLFGEVRAMQELGVGAKAVSSDVVKHATPMLSLSNVFNELELKQWWDKLNNPTLWCEMKYDGLSISLTYVDGKLVRGVTRGDGVHGDDVTANVKTIRCIPLVLKEGSGYPQEFEIRGEILMPWKVFERLNAEREAAEEPLFANPRNAASGTLKSQNSKLVASRQLDAYLYYLL
jgi:DNA ligase (NAD+)